MSPIAMTEMRLEALAEAYGGDIARWPADEREAAQRLLAKRPASAALLAPQQRLDAFLAAHPVREPPAALRQAILAAAPTPQRASPLLRWILGAGVGLALVGAGAGVFAGLELAPAAMTRFVTGVQRPPPEDIGSPADPVGLDGV